MVIIEQFTAQFEVKLAVKLGDTFSDMLRLNLQVFLVVKSYLHIMYYFAILPAKVVKKCELCMMNDEL